MRIITICGFLAMAAILSIGQIAIDTAARFIHAVPRLTRRVFGFIGDLCLDVIRADYGSTIRVDRWVLAAYKRISLLKPEYENSLQTDGQNFERDVRLASHC